MQQQWNRDIRLRHFLFTTSDINTTVLYYRSPTVKRIEHRALLYPFWHRPISSGETIKKNEKRDDTLAWSTRHMERSARSRLERGRKAEKEESRKKKRLLVFSIDPLTWRIFIMFNRFSATGHCKNPIEKCEAAQSRFCYFMPKNKAEYRENKRSLVFISF